MARSRGGAETRRFILGLPEVLRRRVLPGATRAGATVIAEEAQHLLGGKQAEAGGGAQVLIADSVKVRTRRIGTVIRARVLLDGPGAYVGRWLEWGTDPHFITVDREASGGRTARRVNKLVGDGHGDLKATLVINGKPVGTSVYHPGARPEPFMRPARDIKEAEAIAAAQGYINRSVTRRGIIAAAEPEGDDA